MINDMRPKMKIGVIGGCGLLDSKVVAKLETFCRLAQELAFLNPEGKGAVRGGRNCDQTSLGTGQITNSDGEVEC